MEESPIGKLKTPGDVDVQERLLRYLQGGRVHPGVLLVGPKTPQRWSLAKNISKQLLCPKAASTGIFCDECSFCRRIEKEIHPDVLLYQAPEEDTIKIDTLRELCQQMALTPMEAQGKVCVIEECHRMNSAAANAFLKTLEEPADQRFFWLLTSQPSSLPATLLSRCLKFRLTPAPKPSLYSPEDEAIFSQWLSEALQAKSAAALVLALTTKEKTAQFLSFFQIQLRNAVTGEAKSLLSLEGPQNLQAQFYKSVELERRLHSNANYSLMLDSFFRQYFAT